MSQPRARRPRCRPGAATGICARGIAEIVTDPALTAEPLATPGVVVKHSRGTTSAQIAALPDRKTKPAPVANHTRESQPHRVDEQRRAYDVALRKWRG